MDAVTMKKERNYGIDALRIVSMFLIVILHVLGGGGVLSAAGEFTGRYMILWFIEAMAYCAANCYALISGYVGYKSKHKYTNLAMLWLRVVLYSAGISLLFYFIKPGSVSVSDIMKAFFPVYYRYNWYFTGYFILFLFLPILNKAINALSRSQLKAVIITMIIAFSLGQAFIFEGLETSGGYSGMWLIVLYLIGAYIGKYDAFRKVGAFKAFVIYILFCAISWVLSLLRDYLLANSTDGTVLNDLASHMPRFVRYISPTILVTSVALLLFFRSIRFPKFINKIISVLAPLSFSVVLIHSHPLMWTKYINGKFTVYASYSIPKMLLFVFAAAAVIYLVCSAIDLIREYLFKWLHIKEGLSKLEKKLFGQLWNE